MRARLRSPFHPLLTLALVCGVSALLSGQASRGPDRTRVVRPPATKPVPTVSRGLRSNPRRQTGPRPVVTEVGGDRVARARFVPDDVIVKFRGGASTRASIRRTAAAIGARELQHRGHGAFAVLRLDPGSDPETVARELDARSDVEFAQPNYLRQPLFTPNDDMFGLQWNMTQIGMDRAWDVNRGATDSVVVAVIDSGVAFEDTTVEFLADAFQYQGRSYPRLGLISVPFAVADDLAAPDRFVSPFDFVWQDEHPVDMSGHGTHVAGTLGQLTDNGEGVAGVAFNVRIMPLKVLADEWDFIFGAVPACCGAADADIADAIRHAVDQGAEVINMSLGGPEESPVIDEAVEFAVSQGVFVAIAGGNSFEEGNDVIWPAAAAEQIDGAVSVAAVDRQSRRAPYSNTGSYIEISAPGGDQRADEMDGVVQQTLDPEFAFTFLAPPSRFEAPRFDVLSFVFFQGTSMASPHVAGLAALLKAQGVSSPEAIEAALKATATDLGDPGDDDEFGAGLVDAAALVRGLGLAR